MSAGGGAGSPTRDTMNSDTITVQEMQALLRRIHRPGEGWHATGTPDTIDAIRDELERLGYEVSTTPHAPPGQVLMYRVPDEARAVGRAARQETP